MYKILNLFLFLLIIIFILSIYKYYSSNKNISIKNYNLLNIEEILKEKTIGLPILTNDTNNVIEFNNSLNNEININKKRSFWDLLKNK
tara:strand:+ start:9692 stop:9955 length:264 start_codon:yes stop_codon:yes gene_type:complete